jgi:hypothetical protein
VAQSSFPPDEEVAVFLASLRKFRDTLPENQQRLLNAMCNAAMGTIPSGDDDTRPFWYLPGPGVTPTSGPTALSASPWSSAYVSTYK